MAGDGLSGIDQGFERCRGFFAIVKMNADLGDAIGGGVAARGFYVYDGVQEMLDFKF